MNNLLVVVNLFGQVDRVSWRVGLVGGEMNIKQWQLPDKQQQLPDKQW